MRRLLICLCLLLFAAAGAEENCSVCGGCTADCTLDASGAIYCTGTLVQYPAEQTAECYTVRDGTRYIGSEAFCNTGLKEIWLRMTDLECGETVLHPGNSYDPAPPVTIHMCDAVIEEELGNAMNFCLAYQHQPNLTFVFDILYCD